MKEEKIRNIKELKSKGLSNRKIAAKLHASRQSINKYGSVKEKSVKRNTENQNCGFEIGFECRSYNDKINEITKFISLLDTNLLKNMLKQNVELRKMIVSEIRKREGKVNEEEGWVI